MAANFVLISQEILNVPQGCASGFCSSAASFAAILSSRNLEMNEDSGIVGHGDKGMDA